MIVIDFETYSEADLPNVGAWRYAVHPSTEALILCWSRPGEPVRTWVQGDALDPELIAAVAGGEDVLAHNAGFDRAIWEHVAVPKHGFPPVAGRWLDSKALCSLLGLPRSLGPAATALGLEQTKDTEGKRLVRQFSMPHGGAFSRVSPWDAPEDWKRFVAYCEQDVRTTIALFERLSFHLPQLERDHACWEVDYQMNARGVLADLDLAQAIVAVAEPMMAEIERECAELTGGIGPGQVKALSVWLRQQDVGLETLGEIEIGELLRGDVDPVVRRVLELRLEGSRSSWRKCYVILSAADDKHRLHNQLEYGSTHTYRWAGRGVQLQNLPRPKFKKPVLEAAIAALFQGPDTFQALFDRPMEAISSLMRSTIIAPTGSCLGISDYSKIEVCVLAWLAGDGATVAGLHEGADLYRELAAKIYDVSESAVTPDQRFTGKSGILGGGYGAGWKAFQGSCRKQNVQIPDSLAKATIAAYRDKHAPVVLFWSELEQSAIRAVKTGEPQPVGDHLTFRTEDKWLFCDLPSGRSLAWFEPRLATRTRYGKRSAELRFTGTGKNGKPVESHTFGGRLAENVVSSTARDLLAESLVLAEKQGLNPVLTVHDEIVCEGPPGIGKALAEVMLTKPEWAQDVPVAVEYQEEQRYGK